MPNYREVDAVYIEFNTGHPDIVGEWEVRDIGMQGGATNGVSKVKWIKILRKFKKKVSKYYITHGWKCG